METTEKIYYCEQGNPYCIHPKCLCNTVRPEVESHGKETQDQTIKLSELLSYLEELHQMVDSSKDSSTGKILQKAILNTIRINYTL